MLAGPTYRSDCGATSDDPRDLLPTRPIASLARLSLYFATPAISGEFAPEVPWLGIRRERRLQPLPASVQHDSSILEHFTAAVGRCIGDGQRIGIALSGGLDSAAVLYTAAQILKRDGRALVAFTSPARDDDGLLNTEVASRLVDALAPRVQLVVVPDDSAGTTAWSWHGPGLDSAPSARAAVNRAAEALGVDVILTGVGADEMLGAPRYLTRQLLRHSVPAGVRYAGDVQGLSLLAKLAVEAIAWVSELLRLPPSLYWTISNPELSDLRPSRVLTPDYADIAAGWTRAWLASILEIHARHHHTWAERDVWDGIFPYDALPAAGAVREASPYTEHGFAEYALRIPVRHRYHPERTSAYHRGKGLVVLLLPEPLSGETYPSRKSWFSSDLGAQARARIRSRLPLRAVELGLLDGRAVEQCVDTATLHMVVSVEDWIRGAEERGAVLSRATDEQ